ncbi:AP2-associated protein kinase 1-like [Paramacrobiotus metropolitanus]|uniref:AP2-associated protein kinase 1-like n=1 Tax=Paramacrobiotus metropolitanus TaxID=2943436 RepID=UPI00244577DC|nr:AP2-associated protein kinase 1-like [Paramacrobiotus metropolitanus]XP_055353977.1 AP2-associated protein kinase 1-like [Paramacrobiotus metropolitanus]
MGDLIRSALDYIGGGQTPAVKDDSDLVGNIVEIENRKFRVKRLIAEGGYAYVYLVQDVEGGKDYALKRLLAHDEDAAKNIKQEIRFLKKLTGHPYIIGYVAAALCKRPEKANVEEYLILTEFCSGGQVISLLKNRELPLSVPDVLTIFYQTCKAVQHMHKQSPAIIHRDLKVENLLIGEDRKVKLCDFGSATTETHAPDMSWESLRRNLVEEEMTRNTTPMYRAPEMLDLYNNYPINEKLDIWALGCILYTLCYMVHPFEDSAKLRILNAKYSFPPNRKYEIFNDLISRLLKIDPVTRPNIDGVLEILASMAETLNVETNKSLTVKIPSPVVEAPNPGVPQRRNEATENKPTPTSQPTQSQQQGSLFGSVGGGLLGNLVKGGKNIVKNVQQAAANLVKEDFSARPAENPSARSQHGRFVSYSESEAESTPNRKISQQPNQEVDFVSPPSTRPMPQPSPKPPRPQPPRSPKPAEKAVVPPRPPSASPSLDEVNPPPEPLLTPEEDLLGLGSSEIPSVQPTTQVPAGAESKTPMPPPVSETGGYVEDLLDMGSALPSAPSSGPSVVKQQGPSSATMNFDLLGGNQWDSSTTKEPPAANYSTNVPIDPFMSLGALSQPPPPVSATSRASPTAAAAPTSGMDNWLDSLGSSPTSVPVAPSVTGVATPTNRASPLLLPQSPHLSRPGSNNSLNSMAASKPVSQSAPDPFGDLFGGKDSSKPLLTPMTAELPRNTSNSNLAGMKRDPFADLGNLGGSISPPVRPGQPANPMMGMSTGQSGNPVMGMNANIRSPTPGSPHI